MKTNLLKTSKIRLIHILFGLIFAFNLGYPGITDEIPEVPPGISPQPDPLFDQEVLKGIHYTFHDEYERALALFDSLIQRYPDQPAPYFFKAASYQNWMSTFRFNAFQEELERDIETAIKKGEALNKKEPNAWVHFYMGAAYGYRGFHRFRKHNWLGAYKDGKRGVNNFKKAFEIDTTLYDIYLGLGTYHYWRTAKSKFLRILTFWMSDKRDLGIRQIKFAKEHGRYAPSEATYVLLTSLFDYKKYNEALEILNGVMQKKVVPNMADLYFQGRLMAEFNDWEKTESAFHEILNRIENYPYPSVGYQVECKYWISVALNGQGKTAEAAQLAREALQLGRKRDKNLELEGPLEGFDEIYKRLSKLYQNIARASRN